MVLFFSVSHTTYDLVFKWNITDPLVTNPDIELPQLDIAKNTTEDCTLEYSTGQFTMQVDNQHFNQQSRDNQCCIFIDFSLFKLNWFIFEKKDDIVGVIHQYCT